MSEPNQGDPTDLFDFPEVEGMEEFGLTPPPGWGEEAPEDEAPAEDVEAPADAPPAAEPRPATAPAASAGDARPNPPVPGDVSDLDEDLFGFDELFSQDDDPYQNGTLTPEGRPVNPVPAPEPAPAPAAAEPEPAPAAAAPEPAPAAPQPAREETARPQAEPAARAAEPPPAPASSAPHPQHAVGSLMAQPAERAALDRGPRILLPEDVPYSSGATARDARIIWALVACFLIVNTGIFWLAHLASTNVNQSITNATGVIAEALSGRGSAPVYGAQPPAVPDVVYAPVEDEDASPARDAEPWVDPRNFEGTHEFAVGRAKALLSVGRFEDARRLLFNVLANKDRVPLEAGLREEIEYLIPLTYYDQGRAIEASDDADAEGGR